MRCNSPANQFESKVQLFKTKQKTSKMKFAICLLLSCLSLISAHTTGDHHVQSWGNVQGHELGSHYVKVTMDDNKHAVYEFTYPRYVSINEFADFFGLSS